MAKESYKMDSYGIPVVLDNNQCPVCGTNGNTVFFVNSREYVFYKCTNCECLFIDNNLPVDSYPKNALGDKNKKIDFIMDYRSNRNWTWALSDAKWIGEYIKVDDFQGIPKVLSIGCAFAHDLYELRKMGWSVLGLDYDEDFVTRVKRQHDIDVVSSSLEDADFEGEFQLVMLFGVLPYLYNMKETFTKINKLLNDTGYLVISGRSVDFGRGKEVLKYPTNIHARQYLSEKSFGKVLPLYGFDLVSIDSFTIRIPWLEKLPTRVKSFEIGVGRYKISPILDLLNFYYIFMRWLKVETFVSCARVQSDTLRIVAKKIKSL